MAVDQSTLLVIQSTLCNGIFLVRKPRLVLPLPDVGLVNLKRYLGRIKRQSTFFSPIISLYQ